MDAFFQWLSSNPTVTITLQVALTGLVLAVALIYVVAFIQGREVSFWPPKIGIKPEKKRPSEETDGSVEPSLSKPDVIQVSSSRFLSARELSIQQSVAELIEQSEDLLFGGVALRHVVQRNRPQLLKQLQNGAKLRFLVLDPNSPDISPMADIFEVSPEHITDAIRITLHEIDFLKSKAELIKSGSVEVRLLVREPAFSFALSDPKSSAGVFTAGLRVYGHSSSTRPFWVLRPSDKWFHFFVKSCEKLWNASQPWELDHEIRKPISQKAGVVAYQFAGSGNVEILLITARINSDSWIFPVGTVDPGETLQQAAARECQEETGYTVKVGPKLGMIEIDEGKLIKQMTFFIGRTTGETAWNETDRRRKWVQRSELINCIAEDFLPIARAAVVRLASFPTNSDA